MVQADRVRAVIFDFGGVLLRTEDRSIRGNWESKLGLAPGEADEIVFNSEMGKRAQLGAIGYDQLWAWIGRHLNLDEEMLVAFHDGFWAGDELDESLVAYIRLLKERYRTALLSNYHHRLRAMLHEKYRIADAFDLIVCSAEEQVMKPDWEIYRRALERLRLKPQEAIFIDDSPANVDAAKELGMYGLLFTPQLDLRQALVRAGVDLQGDI